MAIGDSTTTSTKRALPPAVQPDAFRQARSGVLGAAQSAASTSACVAPARRADASATRAGRDGRFCSPVTPSVRNRCNHFSTVSAETYTARDVLHVHAGANSLKHGE